MHIRIYTSWLFTSWTQLLLIYYNCLNTWDGQVWSPQTLCSIKTKDDILWMQYVIYFFWSTHPLLTHDCTSGNLKCRVQCYSQLLMVLLLEYQVKIVNTSVLSINLNKPLKQARNNFKIAYCCFLTLLCAWNQNGSICILVLWFISPAILYLAQSFECSHTFLWLSCATFCITYMNIASSR